VDMYGALVGKCRKAPCKYVFWTFQWQRLQYIDKTVGWGGENQKCEFVDR